jgi:ribosomal protein S18 acetylase RimI-like enzyme
VNDRLRLRGSRLRPDEADAMAAVAARAFLADPLTVAVFGGDPSARERRLRCVYGAMFRALPRPPLSAWRGERALGLLGLSPARSVPPPARAVAALPLLLRGARPRELRPAMAWLRGVAGARGEKGDWRLGPLVVDPSAHGEGVGSALLRAACEHLDSLGAGVLVSTDVEENVAFYRRFGFAEIGGAEVAGQRVWHLRRAGA